MAREPFPPRRLVRRRSLSCMALAGDAFGPLAKRSSDPPRRALSLGGARCLGPVCGVSLRRSILPKAGLRRLIHAAPRSQALTPRRPSPPIRKRSRSRARHHPIANPAPLTNHHVDARPLLYVRSFVQRTSDRSVRKVMVASILNCWLCGGPADSAEHRFKKSDLIRAHGKGPYIGPTGVVHVRDGLISRIQGPGSSKLKYEPSLCHACNTGRTQPYDYAYDRLMDWVATNEHFVLRTRMINFEEVYGSNHQECQVNLFKYFVKSFGCQLVQARHAVPSDLVALMPLNNFRTASSVSFSVNEDILLMPNQARSSFGGKGVLIGARSSLDPSVSHNYTWYEHVSWFAICYWYGREAEGALGRSFHFLIA